MLDDHKHIMYEVRLRVTEYDLDNKTIYIDLKNAMLALRAHFEENAVKPFSVFCCNQYAYLKNMS